MSSSRPPQRRALRAASILEELLEQRGMDHKLREYRAWQVWEQVVGGQIARHARPLRLREGVLEVRVDQPIWMQQLQLMAPQILAKLNRTLGEELIRSIFWRRGKLETRELAAETAPPAKPLPPLDEQSLERISQATSTLTDADVKSSLASLLALQARLDKRRQQEDDSGAKPRSGG